MGCSAADEETAPKLALLPGPTVAELPLLEHPLPDPCRAAIDYENELEKMRQEYSETHPDVVRLRRLADSEKAKCIGTAGHAPRSGQWAEKDGVLVCDGFMTRRADQDYCSSEVPEDWVPFTFDGKEYYVQPLTERR